MLRYLKLREVCVELDLSPELVDTLQGEGLIEVKHSLEDEPLLSAAEAEKLRVIAVLMRDLDVNLAGVEVILHMREDLRSMHEQFEEVLRTLVEELRKRMP
jgi:MerR family transcriptional regulator/heat shock protein HspR